MALWKKRCLLLRRLGTTEYYKFVDFILPKKTTDVDFSETIKLLSELFGPNTTLSHKRWKCLNTVKDNQQDFLTFSASVNKLDNDFKQAELTADDLKCFIFAQGLVSAEDAEVRRQVMTKLENEQGLTLQKLAEDCQRVISVNCDSKTIEESGVAQVRKIKSKSTAYSRQKDKRQISCSKPHNKQNAIRLKKLPGPCYHCGKWHWMKFCPVKKIKYCKNCNKNGHNLTQCWHANITGKPKSKIRQVQSDEIVNRNLRKYDCWYFQ